MPKRSAEDKIQFYRNKIKKLQNKSVKRRKRVIVYSDSSDFEENPVVETNNIENPLVQTTSNKDDDLIIDEDVPSPQNENKDQEAVPDVGLPALDPEVLRALGELVPEQVTYGEDIHPDLAQRWAPILRKGLADKDQKDKICKDYATPQNCKLFRAPTLNPEIAAAVSEFARARDKKIENSQQQLGVGLTAINRAITVLLTGDNKVQAIKYLSDASRILSDLHASETQIRTKSLTQGLEKSFLNLIQDSERDEMLFGSSLPEKIKASKAIEKQGSQIKKADPKAMPGPSRPRPTRQQENWRGSSRPNRGGRGGSRKTPYTNQKPVSFVTTKQQLHTNESLEQTPSCRPSDIEGKETIESYPGGREALRNSFIRQGTPVAALDIMLSSLAQNTLQQYSSTYKLWWTFCKDSKLNPYNSCTESVVISFLTALFNQGAAYGSLNSHRSALALLLNCDLSNNHLINRFFKGVYKLRPTLPKYIFTWDPQVVLNHIAQWKPHDELSIEKLTKKVTVLLALCTAHRAQTLSLIKINNIKISSTDIKIVISDLIKTSKAGREQPLLILPYFSENKDICPATAIKDYICRTEQLRQNNVENLLLTFKPPHRAATSQTIARWVKQVLAESGIDVSTFSAHSTRHAATSAARNAGVSLDVIRKTAGWTPASGTFASFYNRHIADTSIFARAVCLRDQS